MTPILSPVDSFVYGKRFRILHGFTLSKFEVLKTIEKMQNQSTLPAPFSQNCQYKKNQPDDGSDQDGAAEPAAKPRSKANPKKKKKKAPAQISKAKLAKESEKANSEVSVEQGYQAHHYSDARKAFINKLKDDGVSASDAAEQWNASSLKRDMLSTLTLQELKRRRFVSKECQDNPWAK